MKRKIFKEDIIKAGYELMYLNGYNATGIKEITDRVNIPKGSFYNHFATKQEFGLEVLNYYSEMGKQALIEGLINSKLSPITRLKKFYKSQIEYFEHVSENKLGCLMGNFSQELGDTNTDFQKALNEDFINSTAIFKSCFDEAKAMGEIDESKDTTILAEYITNAWQGALLRMKSNGNIKPLEDFYTITFRLLLN